jgi:hypothetical protein
MNINPVNAWTKFWFGPVSAKPLGAFRILFGLIAFLNLLLLFVDAEYWLTDRGVIQRGEAAEIAAPFRYSFLFSLRDPTSVYATLTAATAAAVGLTLGWQTKIMSMLFYFLMLAIHHRNVATTSGADVLLMCTAFYLMLSPCGAAYSLDALREKKKRGGSQADALICPWAQRLIQIQLSLMYIATVIWKSSGTTWLDGTATHYVLCNRELGRWDLSFLAAYPTLVNFLTYSGLGIEILLGTLLWSKSARPWVILTGAGLHIGIMAIVNIPVFGELSIATYITFLTSSEWETVVGKLVQMSQFARFKAYWAFLTSRTRRLSPTFQR